MEASDPIAGGCMCGGVRFELSEPLLGALYCHCTRCQRRTGTGASVSALTAPGSYRTVAGEELLDAWDPGDGGWVKSFCRHCGSHVFTTNPENPELVSVRMGAIDGDPGVRPPVRAPVHRIRRDLGAGPRRWPAALCRADRSRAEPPTRGSAPGGWSSSTRTADNGHMPLASRSSATGVSTGPRSSARWSSTRARSPCSPTTRRRCT